MSPFPRRRSGAADVCVGASEPPRTRLEAAFEQLDLANPTYSVHLLRRRQTCENGVTAPDLP
jgi:hypothetical protein